MTIYYNLYTELSNYLGDLEAKYIRTYIPADPSEEPAAYRLDVMAYCLLVHAAVENFVEQVGRSVIESAVNDWIQKRRLTTAIVSLLAHSDSKAAREFEEGFVRYFDRTRVILEKAKGDYSKAIYENHGITEKDLRILLYPCGIDLLDDVGKRESMKRLSLERGAYAHRGKVEKVMPPEDAHNVAQDCLAICEDIAKQANKMFP